MPRQRRHLAIQPSGAVSLCWWLVVAPILAIVAPTFADQQTASGGGTDLPDAVKGKWKVESVLVDLAATRTLHYQRDDPHLVGSRFTVSDQSIQTDTPEARECQVPKGFIWKSTAARFIAMIMAPHGDPKSPVTPKDFELPLTADAPVAVLSIACRQGRFGPRASAAARRAIGSNDIGTWLLVLPSGELAVRWFDETILLLRRTN